MNLFENLQTLKESKENLDNDKIEILNLSVRAYNSLKRAGITYVKELDNLELQQIKGINRDAIIDIQNAITKYDIENNTYTHLIYNLNLTSTQYKDLKNNEGV